jgi:hypothetical protein
VAGIASQARRKRSGAHFIQSAIKRPGQLHRDLGVPQGQKIPPGKMAAALRGDYGPQTKRRAEFAKALGSFRH